MIANGVQDDDVARIAKQYDLSTVIYGMNLNDILPVVSADAAAAGNVQKPFLHRAQLWVEQNLDGHLRGTSYLYNGVRTLFKNALTRLGYSHTGFKAAELYPKENEALIRSTAERVNALAIALKKENIGFCVILFPYEMQISNDAASVYRDLGIHWEDGFEQGSTQALLKKYLRVPALYDGREAFAGLENTAKVGDYFVYNKGDKIDFNHPNRAGHAALTQGLLKSHSCPAF